MDASEVLPRSRSRGGGEGLIISKIFEGNRLELKPRVSISSTFQVLKAGSCEGITRLVLWFLPLLEFRLVGEDEQQKGGGEE